MTRIDEYHLADTEGIPSNEDLYVYEQKATLYKNDHVELAVVVNCEYSHRTAVIYYQIDEHASAQNVIEAVDFISDAYAVSEPIVCFKLMGRVIAALTNRG